jgi:hypothetical protein
LTGRAPILLTGLTEETDEEVDLCLERRKTVAVWAANGTARLLGGDDVLKQTFAAGSRRGTFRASELAADLGTSLQNMNNRLKRLIDAGALLRDRQDPTAAAANFATEHWQYPAQIRQAAQGRGGLPWLCSGDATPNSSQHRRAKHVAYAVHRTWTAHAESCSQTALGDLPHGRAGISQRVTWKHYWLSLSFNGWKRSGAGPARTMLALRTHDA